MSQYSEKLETIDIGEFFIFAGRTRLLYTGKPKEIVVSDYVTLSVFGSITYSEATIQDVFYLGNEIVIKTSEYPLSLVPFSFN